MNQISLHRVVSVDIQDCFIEPENRKPFWTKEIMVTDDDGSRMRIILFSVDGQQLNETSEKNHD